MYITLYMYILILCTLQLLYKTGLGVTLCNTATKHRLHSIAFLHPLQNTNNSSWILTHWKVELDMYAYFVICYCSRIYLPECIKEEFTMNGEEKLYQIQCTYYYYSVKAIQSSAKFKYNYYKSHPHPIDSSIEEG